MLQAGAVLEADEARPKVRDAERKVRAGARHEHARRGDAEPVRERGDVRGREGAVHEDLRPPSACTPRLIAQ